MYLLMQKLTYGSSAGTHVESDMFSLHKILPNNEIYT
jgi:hypothetical protein